MPGHSRKEVSSWSGEVLGSTLHTGLRTTDLFSEDATPGTPLRVGARVVSGLPPEVRCDADGPGACTVGLGLGERMKSPWRHGRCVAYNSATATDSGPTSERVGEESGVDNAGPPASDVTVDGTRTDELC